MSPTQVKKTLFLKFNVVFMHTYVELCYSTYKVPKHVMIFDQLI
jgi:hypothetical protein